MGLVSGLTHNRIIWDRLVLILLLVLAILLSWAVFSTRDSVSCIRDGLDGDCTLGDSSPKLLRDSLF